MSTKGPEAKAGERSPEINVIIDPALLAPMNVKDGAGARDAFVGHMVAYVIDSYEDSENYLVDLEFRNFDIHAAYIEKIDVSEPLKLIRVEVGRESGWLSSANREHKVPPRRILSQCKAEIRLVIDKSSISGSCGLAQITLSRLGEQCSEVMNVQFLVRMSLSR